MDIERRTNLLVNSILLATCISDKEKGAREVDRLKRLYLIDLDREINRIKKKVGLRKK
jgi:hypothetical protein